MRSESTINRPINKFHGECAIIGCSCSLSIHQIATDKLGNSHHKDHKNSENFYSVDYQNKNADYIIDVTAPEFAEQMNDKFNFVWLECLPPECFLQEDNSSFNPKSGIYQSLKDNGILLIQGGMPIPYDQSINSEKCQIYTNSYLLSTSWDDELKKACLVVEMEGNTLHYKFLTPDNKQIEGKINKDEFSPELKKTMKSDMYNQFESGNVLPYKNGIINETLAVPSRIMQMILKKENINNPMNSKSCIIIKGTENNKIDPNLIILSLNKDAQNAILNSGIDIKALTAHLKFDPKSCSEYLKQRSLEIIDKQISRLADEFIQLTEGFFDKKQKSAKSEKLDALKNLKFNVEKGEHVHTIIRNKEFSVLLSGHSHRTGDSIQLIMNMEKYYNENKKNYAPERVESKKYY